MTINRSAAPLIMCIMVGATQDNSAAFREDGHCVHDAVRKGQIVHTPAQYPGEMEESDNVNLLQLRPPFRNCPPIPVNRCNLESRSPNMDIANRSLVILLRGEPFRVGEHDKTSIDFTSVGQIEQKRAAESHVKFLIQPFEDMGFKVQVVGVIPERVASVAPNATAIKSLEETYRPWLQAGFRVVDSKSQLENWRLAWEDLFHSRVSSSAASLVLRFDVVLKTNLAQVIVPNLHQDPGTMWIPFFEPGQNPNDPGALKMSDMFQWVPHQLQRCLADNFYPDHLCGWRTYAKLIGVKRIGALWRNPGSFSGCNESTTNPQWLPNALYRLAGRPEGQMVTTGGCPFLSSD